MIVMLANRKTAEMVDAELSDLIGGEYDPAFTDSLFALVAERFPRAPSVAPAEPMDVDSRRQGRAPVNGAAGIFTAAMNGVGQKRAAPDLLPGRDGPPAQQRMRTDDRDGAPRGPRGGQQQQNGRRGDGERDIFARVGASRQTGVVNPAFMGPPGPQMTPQVFQQQIESMQRAGGFGPPNGQMPFFGFPGAPFPFPFFPQPGFSGQMAPQPSFLQPTPSAPTDEELCKFGVTCNNAYCKYSHPSPVATKESGLVLTKEACEQQLACEDKVRLTIDVELRNAGLPEIAHLAASARSGQVGTATGTTGGHQASATTSASSQQHRTAQSRRAAVQVRRRLHASELLLCASSTRSATLSLWRCLHARCVANPPLPHARS